MNPFDDIIPRMVKQADKFVDAAALEKEKAKAARDARLHKKSLTLLSFGEEAGEDETEIAPVAKGGVLCDVLCSCSTAGYLSFGPIENKIMVFVTSACARRTGASARVERRRRER